MRATKRLRVIANLIDDKNKIVADIGADHGYLAKMLVDENRAKLVYATDISADSIEKTIMLIEKYSLQNLIKTKVGDGLKPLSKKKIHTAVIAGMGGYEIIKILQENENTSIEKYIFQPVQNAIELRTFLNENNYEIIKDFIVEDKNKFYSTIEVVKSNKKQVLNEEQLEFGLTNFDLKHKDFYNYLVSSRGKLINIRNRANLEKIDKKIKIIDNVISRLYN